MYRYVHLYTDSKRGLTMLINRYPAGDHEHSRPTRSRYAIDTVARQRRLARLVRKLEAPMVDANAVEFGELAVIWRLDKE